MKKLVGLTLAIALLTTGSAEARVTATASPPHYQAFAAGNAFFDLADPETAGPMELWGASCNQLKRDRWRCPRTFTGALPDGTPIMCGMKILVSREWWRFPPEWFGCPAEWLAH